MALAGVNAVVVYAMELMRTHTFEGENGLPLTGRWGRREPISLMPGRRESET